VYSPFEQPAEPVLYVNDARYEHLWEMLKDTRSRSAAADVPASHEVQGVLFHEARLLDDRRYDEWLAMFVPECLYWVPSRIEPGDPRTETGIYLDDRRRSARSRGDDPHRTPARADSTVAHAAHADQRRAMDVCGRQFASTRKRGHLGTPQGPDARLSRDGKRTRLCAMREAHWRCRPRSFCLLDCDEAHGNYAFIL
jgi:hypothetical protein